MKRNLFGEANRFLTVIAKRWNMRTAMVLLLLSTTLQTNAAEKLNVVFIMADNQNDHKEAELDGSPVSGTFQV